MTPNTQRFSRARAGRGDSGAIVGLLAIAVALSVAVALGALTITGLMQARTRAANAADLAALAVGEHLFDSADPCDAGSAIARANGAELRTCELEGAAVAISVTVPIPGWIARVSRDSTIRADARAEVVVDPEARSPT
ncbi:MAG: Rv3654c family TadE-like protein [Candidatus Nanopelagicales bacterium]|nr:pilus assembly protein TadG-related protein [Candidatus Nanopelagicales bacterium]MDZ4248715.1 Rv3654c family TadE-like protein [Candidatus Nanopelagicales bacterium]